jgi:hypothetical protein
MAGQGENSIARDHNSMMKSAWHVGERGFELVLTGIRSAQLLQ